MHARLSAQGCIQLVDALCRSLFSASAADTAPGDADAADDCASKDDNDTITIIYIIIIIIDIDIYFICLISQFIITMIEDVRPEGHPTRLAESWVASYKGLPVEGTICIYIYIYTYVFAYVCVYTYIYIYIYVYTHRHHERGLLHRRRRGVRRVRR